ncbi:MAG: UDP-N-acetylmuramate--L-alanine ligase [bacterium]|nr:UDP-N-acetylmuramate--L-alanine ligase [bacterium]
MDLRKYKKFYFIGIKGVGMTMLAQFLHGLGRQVSGSDIADVFMTDQVLKKEGIRFRSSFDASLIPTDAVIIYSAAFNAENNEEMRFVEANKRNFDLPILNYAQAIGALFNSYKGIAVCGSHGKTTTTAWLGYVLRHLGVDASVLVGARVPQFKASAVRGKSEYFVAEADEYLDKLQYLLPQGIVLNNIDYDHPDFFKTHKSYYEVFARFTAKLKKNDFLVANVADAQVRKLLLTVKGKLVTYALASKLKSKIDVTLLGHSVRREDGWQYFQVNDFGEFKIQLFGDHNIENALAVLASAYALGLDPRNLKKALAGFKGTARRAELMGKYQGMPVYDDYGHHPTEVKATLKSFKESFPKRRLVAVFHPHTFTRTKALYKEFLTSFDEADVLGILEIYGSAREVQGGISSRDLISGLKAKGRKKPAKYLADFDDALSWLKKTLKPNDVLLLIGAGDIFRVGERLIKR